MRPPALRIHADELVVDNFAGGGGASTGLEWALGRSPDFAVNHDPEAIAMHAANHPSTKHFTCDVFEVNPREVCGSRKIGLAWFSPDCTFFSRAKGGAPFRDPKQARKRRGLAGVVIRWASLPEKNKPRIIICENVAEFEDWGPLAADGRPDKLRAGLSFRRWLGRLKGCGYEVQWRELVAADYGAPTTRKRLFIIARSDGKPIVWPKPTHGAGLIPWRGAAGCIDFGIPAHSIFLTAAEVKARGLRIKRPLADNTLARIARGYFRYGPGSARPFIIPVRHHDTSQRARDLHEPFPTITGAHRGEHALVEPVLESPESGDLLAPLLINTRNGERHGRHGEQAPRVMDIERPYPTITAQGSQGALVAAFLARHYGGHENDGAELQMPLPTITTQDHHALITSHMMKLRGGLEDHQNTSQPWTEPAPGLTAGGTHLAAVHAFLVAYYGSEKDGQQIDLPLRTIPTNDRFGLVTTIHGRDYVTADLLMRMLAARELFNCQGLPRDYKIDVVVPQTGKLLTGGAQVRLCGNSVNPDLSHALAVANLSDNPVGIESGAA